MISFECPIIQKNKKDTHRLYSNKHIYHAYNCSHPIFGDTLIFHRKNGWLMDCKSPYAESFNLVIQQLNTVLNQGINKSGKFESTK